MSSDAQVWTTHPDPQSTDTPPVPTTAVDIAPQTPGRGDIPRVRTPLQEILVAPAVRERAASVPRESGHLINALKPTQPSEHKPLVDRPMNEQTVMDIRLSIMEIRWVETL